MQIDAAGTVVIWLPDTQLGKLASLHSHSKVLHIAHGASFVKIIAGQLWAAWTMYPSATGDHKRCVVRIFDVSGTVAVHEGERTWTLGGDDSLGKVTSGCSVPSRPSLLFLGHEYVPVALSFPTSEIRRLRRRPRAVAAPDTSRSGIETNTNCSTSRRSRSLPSRRCAGRPASCGPASTSASPLGPDRLAGPILLADIQIALSGMMEIFDVSSTNWRVVKRWRGHRGTILSLGLDPSSLWTVRLVQPSCETAIHLN